MLAIAVLGLVANIGSALVLHGHEEEDINVRGAFLHVLGGARVQECARIVFIEPQDSRRGDALGNGGQPGRSCRS